MNNNNNILPLCPEDVFDEDRHPLVEIFSVCTLTAESYRSFNIFRYR